MSVTGMLIGVLMVVGSLAWLAFPLLKRQGVARLTAVDPEQIAAYERILQTVRDLDEDYLVGKLPAEKYSAERANWMEQGAAHLESLEKLTGKPASKKSHHPKSAPAQLDSVGQDDAVEQAIAAYIRAREHTAPQER
jgi:hypothetical protein